MITLIFLMEYKKCIDCLKMKNNILLNLWLHFKHKRQYCNKFNFQIIAWKELESIFKLSHHLDYAEGCTQLLFW